MTLFKFDDQVGRGRKKMGAVGIDVGGTFTDLIYFDPDDGSETIHKVPTTPHDPSIGVVAGLRELCEIAKVAPSDLTLVLHGTTTATNAILEGKGAATGMITNSGFRDIVHIARHQRPEHYSIRQELPWQSRPIVPRRHRLTVEGRIVPPTGDELVPLDEAGVREAAEQLKKANVQSVAVCFLFSYLNSEHEDRARRIVEEVHPEAFVTTSSFVAPQFREYERFTTTSLSAYVGPKIRDYIHRLRSSLEEMGVGAELRIMASNGGVATARMIEEKPALTFLSGLAAGVLGGSWFGRQCGRDNLITFDIGGTSADIGIVIDGACTETDARATSIAGLPLLLPMLDIHTIGAGGGSIAFVDPGGAFRVGPQSAGAVPGPVSYGRGGTEPTVTDAHVVLGRLVHDDFLGGGMTLDVPGARAAVDSLAVRLGLSRDETADGILKILNANMANAIRSKTIQKGIDPRDFTLVAMGGAGPLHGADVAAMLGIPSVIIPPYPGIASALGLLTTNLKYTSARTLLVSSNDVEADRVAAVYKELKDDIRADFVKDVVSNDTVFYRLVIDMRYMGQGYEIGIDVEDDVLTQEVLVAAEARFHEAHHREYGHAFPGNEIEYVNMRVIGESFSPPLKLRELDSDSTLDEALLRTQNCVFPDGDSLRGFDTPIYDRRKLRAGISLCGPAILVQMDTTTIVPPGAKAEVEPSGSIIITLGAKT